MSIAVRDDNDHAPNITWPTSVNNTFHVAFSVPAGSVVLKVHAVDKDAHENASVRYAILQGNKKGLFFVNSVTGE